MQHLSSVAATLRDVDLDLDIDEICDRIENATSRPASPVMAERFSPTNAAPLLKSPLKERAEQRASPIKEYGTPLKMRSQSRGREGIDLDIMKVNLKATS